MKAVWRGIPFLWSLTSFGCSELPELEPGTCGNYVIDDGEDCDIHVADPHVCAGPGESNACHYICGTDKVTCPDDYGCGQDGVCRRSSTTFILETAAQGYVWPTAMRTGDFDSDGNGDLLLLGPMATSGYRATRVLFSQGFSVRTGLSILPTQLANPAIGAGAGDGPLRDIAFADPDGVALLRGNSDRTGDFAVFPTATLPPGAHARIVIGDALPDRAGDESIILIDNPDGTNQISGVDFGTALVKLTLVSGGEAELVQPNGFFAGHFDEIDKCAQVVLAYRDASKVDIITPCQKVDGNFKWNSDGPIDSVQLQPSAKIDRGAVAFDIDFDGHQDLVIGAGGRTYVAYGLGNGQFISKKMDGVVGEANPYDLPPIAGGAKGFPLAIADLNADNRPDFIIQKGIIISTDTSYHYAYHNLGTPWSEAVVANLNANALPDIATLVDGTLDVNFFNNAGNGVFGVATLATEGLPRHLTVGDFDGDLIQDLAFSESLAAHGERKEHLSVSFGSPYGTPRTLLTTGKVGELGQIVVGHVVVHSEEQTGVDPAAEIGIVVEGKPGQADSVALLPGRASRAIFSTLPLQVNDATLAPVSLAFGHFGDETADIAALATNKTDGNLSLFAFEAFDEEGLAVPDTGIPLPGDFIASEGGNKTNMSHGAIVASADFDGDHVDEAVVAGAYANKQQAALAIARYDTSSGKFFDLIDSQIFEGRITIDSTMFVDDINGDGNPDIILTTGSYDAPAELIVVWGDGSAHVPDLNQNLQRILLDEMGITAVAALRSPHGKGKMLVVSTQQKTYLLELTSERSWKQTEIPEIGSARAFGVVDFDRDGVEDLAVQLEDGLALVRSVPK